MKHMPHGFTLTELSIVLVIIGLIVGGILVGQNLIQAAAIRAQVTQIEKYNQAVNDFQGKYACLPGDCINATSFFGSSWLGMLGGWSSANGNGDGMILDSYYSAANPFLFSTQGEPPIVFAHLYIAGMTDCCNPASFTGFGAGPAAGVIYPAAKIAQGGLSAMNINGHNGWFLGLGSTIPAVPCGGGNSNDYLNLQAGGQCNNVAALLTPQQAQAFDAKVDDGLATTGNVYVAWVYGGDNHVHPAGYHVGYSCLTNVTPPAYNLTYNSPDCNLFDNWQ